MKSRSILIATVTAAALSVLPGVAHAADVDESANIGSRGASSYTAEGAVAIQAAKENCGVRVNRPHPSGTTPRQIHTRVESFCKTGVVTSNKITGKSYRSRWYGWEHRKTKSNGPKAKSYIRVTVDPSCKPGDKHRWRTEGYGRAVINGKAYTASAYEQNDKEITCRG
ncbi:hypothetical protein GCM10012275_53670 [Longimycelium tulufanense]|uniref:Secreted protein n=1 Tax=Longimycelium tulufanense TaxID=907463 RepID=A0A8J3FX27_9PSEU|nr:hypothetical protein [Longimycelium tulufanense]GGM76183.1 hypothetical protein GCM10012275_53670 [Longimycelium tulufanense]